MKSKQEEGAYSSFLLIGNSNDILNHYYGKQINEFPGKVVRFNNFKLSGFKQRIGTRTDWLSRRACDDVKLFDSKELERVLAFCTFCPYSQGMVKVARQLEQHYGSKCLSLLPAQCFDYAAEIGYKNDLKSWASIGVLTIAYLLKEYPNSNIFIHGFSGLLHSKYFGNGKDSHYHDEKLERSYIDSLIASGKIARFGG